jgi:hypothetical protein
MGEYGTFNALEIGVGVWLRAAQDPYALRWTLDRETK